MNQIRRYDQSFKKNTVLLTNEPGRSVSEVAENLGIRKDLFYRWRREYENSQEKKFSGNGTQAQTTEEKKNKKPWKKTSSPEIEGDIQKTVAIFSKAPK